MSYALATNNCNTKDKLKHNNFDYLYNRLLI